MAEGQPALEPILRKAAQLAIPLIVLGEYRMGLIPFAAIYLEFEYRKPNRARSQGQAFIGANEVPAWRPPLAPN